VKYLDLVDPALRDVALRLRDMYASFTPLTLEKLVV